MSSAPPVSWVLAELASLPTADVYAILAARQQVFCVEQDCAYLDADGLDLAPTLHLLARDAQTPVLGYLRILAPGTKYAEASLGRVLTTTPGRGRGLGRLLVARGLEVIAARFVGAPVRISAQKYLERFYAELGFLRDGDDYLEDDIPHLEMLRPA